MYEPPLPVLSHRPHDRSLYSSLYIAWLRVFLQSIPFARRAPGALMFHIQHVNISMWRKSVECAIFAPMCCIRALENSRLAITVLTAPTLLSTDDVIDHCGCENWLLSLLLNIDLSVLLTAPYSENVHIPCMCIGWKLAWFGSAASSSHAALPRADRVPFVQGEFPKASSQYWALP